MDILNCSDRGVGDLLQGKASTAERNVIEYLLDRGYLFKSKSDEEELIRDIVSRDDKDEYPSDFLLFPTFDCNLRCPYCFQKKNRVSRSNALITRQIVDKAYDAIKNLCRENHIKNPLLYLFGGEPLLMGLAGIIEYILSMSLHNNIRTGIITNGSSLSDYAEILQFYKVGFVQVTLDGPQHIHDLRRKYVNGKGTFDKIIHGIRSIVDSEIDIFIRINIDSHNIDFLPELAEFLAKAELLRDNVMIFAGPYRDLTCYSYQYQLPEHVMLEKIFSIYRKFPKTRSIKLLGWPGLDYLQYFLSTGRLLPPRVSYCISSYGRFSLDPAGRLYACGNATGTAEYAVGRYSPFLELDRKKLALWRQRRFIRMSQCLDCHIAPLCGGGCTLQSLIKFRGRKPYCPNIMENIKAAVNYYFEEMGSA